MTATPRLRILGLPLAAVFQGRIYGAGILTGSFTAQEASDLALGMTAVAFPVAPVPVSPR